jgi:rod shape-determining protein MreD
MRWFRFAVLIIVASVLQAGLLELLNFKPDLLLILLVFFANYGKTSDAIIASFSIGFAADIIGSAMGPQIISFGFFGTALAYLHRVIAIKKIPYQSLVIFITAILTAVLAHFLTFVKLSVLEGKPTPPMINAILLVTSICSALAGPFLFLPVGWWMRIKINRLRRR